METNYYRSFLKYTHMQKELKWGLISRLFSMTTPLQCLVEQGYWVGLGAGADD